jgi:hypothetical protein
LRLSHSALVHLLSDDGHQVRVLSATVADFEALDPLDV